MTQHPFYLTYGLALLALLLAMSLSPLMGWLRKRMSASLAVLVTVGLGFAGAVLAVVATPRELFWPFGIYALIIVAIWSVARIPVRCNWPTSLCGAW